jgi:Flp pilus assembly protein TadD
MYKQVVTLDPSELDAYGRLATLYVKQKKVGLAISEFDKSAERQPKAVEPRTAAAILVHLQGDLKSAKTRYLKILEINPNQPVAANNLAQLYSDQNENLDVALQLAQTAKSGLPNSHEVDDTLGWLYYKKGNGPAAVKSLKAAVAGQKDNAVYLYHLGAAYALNKETANARATLQQALKLQPNFPGADDAGKILGSLK